MSESRWLGQAVQGPRSVSTSERERATRISIFSLFRMPRGGLVAVDSIRYLLHKKFAPGWLGSVRLDRPPAGFGLKRLGSNRHGTGIPARGGRRYDHCEQCIPVDKYLVVIRDSEEGARISKRATPRSQKNHACRLSSPTAFLA